MSDTLYLRLSDTHLSFARFDGGREPHFEFSSYRMRPHTSLTVNLREAESTESILQAPVGRVQALVTGAVTPVPLADFQEEDSEVLYDFCFPGEKKRRIFYDLLPTANVVLLFALEETVCHALEEAFGNVHYVSSLTPVLRHFSTKGSAVQEKRLFAYLHEQAADIAVFEKSRLLLANTFHIHAPVDAAYYILNAAKQLGMPPLQTPFYLAGPAGQRDGVATELRKYATNVYPILPASEFNRHPVAATEGVPYDLATLLIAG